MNREMKGTQRFMVLAIIGCLLFSCASLWGQVTASASLQGTVEDKTHAVIASGNVTITNKETGATRSMKTNGAGEYRFDLLSAGIYNIKVTAQGFSVAEAKDVELLIGRTATQNFTMAPGTVNETVEVTGTAPIVDQAKTDVSMNITPEQVEALPMNARDIGSLAYLAPGVKPVDSYDPTKNRISVFSVNGSSGRNVNVTVNGIDDKDNTVGGPVMQLPLEAVQEFTISTQRFSAANGRSEGAAINVVTKSGTNSFHGAGYGYFRDQALNANDFFSAQAGSPKPPYSRQLFGGAIGGPVKKDKVFLFFAIEKQREHTSLPVSGATFSELSLLTPLGAKPVAAIPTPYFDLRYNGRADYKFNDRHSAYVSYTSQGNNSQNDQSNGLNDLTGGNFTSNQLQIANLTFNSLFSSNIVNQFTAGWQYWNNLIDQANKTPTLTFPGGLSIGTNINVPQQSFQRKWQFKDDVSINHGRHTFKTGFDYLWEPKLGGFFEFNPVPEIDFNQKPDVILALPLKFATPGLVNGMTATAGDPTFIIATKMFGMYFQDDWKVSNRLSVNLGLRWDKDFNLIGGTAVQNSRTFQELQAIHSPLVASTPHDDNKDFSPRIGFAYDLTGGGKHIIRGGYGLYYGQVFENIPLFMIQQANATIFQTTFSITGSQPVPGTAIPLSSWRFGTDPGPFLPPASSQLAGGAVGRMMDPNYRNPYSETFNFGYTWMLTNHSAFEAEYVHELGLHESKTMNVDQAIAVNSNTHLLDAAFTAAGVPVLGRVDDEQSIGRSRYDGMNLTYRQRMWRHFSLDATYTLSRSMAYKGVAAAFRNRPTFENNPFSPVDFGPTGNDERHHINIYGVVDLPFGIKFAPVMMFGSARPYDSNLGYSLGFGAGIGTPNIVVNNSAPTVLTAYKGASAANRAAIQACLAAATCHMLGFDSLRGDPTFELDTRISKTFKLGERPRLEVLANLFNITNRANFGNNFDGNLNDLKAGGTFGQAIGFINPSNTSIPRTFAAEFGFRFSF
jgi:Carboxypeptidase regulatory-like domain/TonB dependent receptor